MSRWPKDYVKKTKPAPKPIGRPPKNKKCRDCCVLFTPPQGYTKDICLYCYVGIPEKQTPTTKTNPDLEALEKRASPAFDQLEYCGIRLDTVQKYLDEVAIKFDVLERKLELLEGMHKLNVKDIYDLQQRNRLPWWKRMWM